jgi:predicted membrane-bound spermidine synthase
VDALSRDVRLAVTFRVRGVAALLFFSGACALIYQVAWFRELRLVFGASTASSAAVLAIFMGGLGLGGAKLGKRADASPNPLALYAKLEIAVACAAGATPALVWLTNTVYIAAGGSMSLGTVGAAALRVLLSILVLGPATFLMGGTLPAAARAVERDDDGPRRSVANLYGVNTFGGVVGAVLANFLLLEVLGTRLTLWIAALVNVLVGMAARSLARSRGARRTTDEEAPIAGSADEPASPEQVAASSETVVALVAPSELPRWFAPAASALVGGSFMLMELVWYRMLGPLLGGSSYTFGLILAVALAGIAIGGIAYARLNVRATPHLLAITCALEALFIAVPYAVGDRLAIVTALARPLTRVSFESGTAVWTAVAAFVVLPAAIVSGFQFPLIIGLYGRGSRAVGRDVGSAYLANTLGSIVGSIAGGFGLVPFLGALGSWRLVVVSLSVGATVSVLVDLRHSGGPRRRAATTAVLAWLPLLLLLVAVGPTSLWRHAGIGAGRADEMLFGSAGISYVPRFTRNHARGVRWEEDGVESSVALSEVGGFNFVVNGKSDGHATSDAPTQVMSGLLGGLLHGNPRSALVVGLGTGSTAGWLGAIPSMERVDVVELERAILRVARDCAPVNEHVLDNPKVHVHIADAREHLRTTNRRYDIIFSEPSNPYRAGISSLYTVEYYRAASERVAPGGLFIQWIQAYEVDGWAVATAVVTLRAVFGDVEIWRTMSGDLLLVARAAHVPLDIERLRKDLDGEPYARAARAVWRTGSAEGVLSHFVARSTLADILVEKGLGAVNTDDQNFLEFAFARSIGKQRRVDSDVRALSQRLGTDTPDVVGRLDALRVQDETWVFQEYDGALSDPGPGNVPTAIYPVIRALSEGRHAPALKQWKSLHRTETASFGELALVAELAARAGRDDDARLIDGAPMPEREALRAIWNARHGDDVGASDALVRSFVAARTTPWIRPRLLSSAIDVAVEIAKAQPRHAQKLRDALVVPFAIEASREQRLGAVARIASGMRDPAACVDAFAPLEPPPWDKALMELRVACYRRANDPRVAVAEADLLQILELDTALGASIPTPPHRTGQTGQGPGGAVAPAAVDAPDAAMDEGTQAIPDAGTNAVTDGAGGTTRDAAGAAGGGRP